MLDITRPRRYFRNRHVNWAFADQAVVSGSNFVIGILLARFLGPESFGVFVLLQAALVYMNSFQGALVLQPMMSGASRLKEAARARYLQGVFAVQVAISLALALVLWLIGLYAQKVAGFEGASALTPRLGIAVACALVAFQLQDWLRRYYFVLENSRAAFINDVFAYGGLVALLAFAYESATLSVVNAFWMMAAASAAAFCVGFLVARLRPTFEDARTVIRACWRAGRDYVAAWQFQWIGSQGVLLVGASMVGAQAAGGVRASQNLVGPVNILFQVMENVVPVVSGKRYEAEGLGALSRYLWRITTVGTVLLFPLLLALAMFAEPLTRLLYGDSYVGYASLVSWAAAAIFLQFYLRITFFFLRTVNATGEILRAGVVMAASAIVVAVLTVDVFHETGIMLALLTGVGAALIYSIFAVRNLARELNASPDASPAFNGLGDGKHV